MLVTFTASFAFERLLLVTCLQGHASSKASKKLLFTPPSHYNPGTLHPLQVFVYCALTKKALGRRWYVVGKVVDGALLTFACQAMYSSWPV